MLSQMHHIQWQKRVLPQQKNQNLLHYQNSNYGNIVVTERDKEYTFYSDGQPVITSPNPDIVYIEEFVHLPMLSHPSPGNVLILSGGAGGVINEVLKHDANKVDFTEVDPVIPEVIKKISTSLTEKELEDQRVNIKEIDSRFCGNAVRSYPDLCIPGTFRIHFLLAGFTEYIVYGRSLGRKYMDDIIPEKSQKCNAGNYQTRTVNNIICIIAPVGIY